MNWEDYYRRQNELDEAQELDYMLQVILDCDYLEVDLSHVGEQKFLFYLNIANFLKSNEYATLQMSKKGFVLSKITDEAISFLEEGGYTDFIKDNHSAEDALDRIN